MTEQLPVITVDGASGTGKGTLSQLLAQEFGWNLLDSGALYRVLALAAQQHHVDLTNEAALEVLARHLDVQFNVTVLSAHYKITLEGMEVTDTIRTETVANNASIVATFPRVRDALLERQREFLQSPGLVADGRDMGTVVFPYAKFKIFLTASCQVRAQRRYQQLKEKGINVNLDSVLLELEGRDNRDKERKTAPLKPATDAYFIDTTELSIGDVLKRAVDEAKLRFNISQMIS